VLNSALSAASCSAATVGAQTAANDQLLRSVTITIARNTSCVYDYYARLAIGAHNWPGSSLHANLADDLTGSTSGIGTKAVSINPNEVAPQELDKDMTATQNSDHIWEVTKSPTPAYLTFTPTCDPAAALTASVAVTVTWTKHAATPSGDITVLTHVYATNPAARAVTINVSDQIYSGTTALGSPATAGPTVIPANTANVLVITHQTTVPDGTADLNDIATATYTDTVTSIPIPGTVTATASATVQTGTELNTSATITDVESITGTGLSFSTDSVTGASGSFNGGYVAGTNTTGPVSWTSSSQIGSGSVTFNKTVYATAATVTSGKLSDTATLTGSDGFTTNDGLDVNVDTSATTSLTVTKVSTLALASQKTYTFHLFNGADVDQGTSTTVTLPAGSTGPVTSTAITGLSATGTYYVQGDASAPFPAKTSSPVTFSLVAGDASSCSEDIAVTNSANPASARVQKTTTPTSSGSWTFTLTGPNSLSETLNNVVANSGYASFASALDVDGGVYTITETAQSGYDLTGVSGDIDGNSARVSTSTTTRTCSFTLDLTTDSGDTFSCSFGNTARGHIIIKKLTNPAGSSQSFEFDPSYSATNFFLADTQTNDSGGLVPGTYSVAEVNIPAGWDLTSSSCTDGSAVTAISLQAGETVTCTFNNRQRGHVRVVKTVAGGPIPAGQSYTFQLRSGASAGTAGTILETLTVNAGTPNGTLNFTTNLVPGTTYQLCEQMQAGWLTSLGPPIYSVYNPSGDNSVVCTDFTVTAGGLKIFNIDNNPPPGGMALTIGYWKNWSSCSGGNQKPVLDQKLLGAANAGTPITLGLLVLNPNTLGASTACRYAVNILNKTTIDGRKKMSSDPLFNMAAQLLAADVNVFSGAGTCAAATSAITQAHALLTKYSFTGLGYSPKLTAADANLANSLGTTLDKYNNNKLC
jgi:hypothetical protein